MKFLYFDMMDYDENEHPVDKMKQLGFKIICAVPRDITDSWWFCVEDFDFDLPPYLSFMNKPFNLNYWAYGCWKNCEYFKKAFDGEKFYYDYCCYGGTKCLKGDNNERNW